MCFTSYNPQTNQLSLMSADEAHALSQVCDNSVFQLSHVDRYQV